jgi:ppGpp synthetase/RelA/SpoT-type nucleotidyltranferase
MNAEMANEMQVLLKKYKLLESIVDERMQNILIAGDKHLIQITHRIKTPESIREKMLRKPDHYINIGDLRDILGFRVICYFSDDVDLSARLISENFRVDWNRSKDKRKLIDARSFGYLSLHYICALPEDEGELSNLWFEVQIMTILQHSWAVIEHDLGYKSEIEVPRDIRRKFSRAASLLETTDEIFADIKIRLDEYKSRVRSDIANESLENIYFDAITLAEFTDHNNTYLSLLNEIAAITGAHIIKGRIENQLPQIEFLGINTLKEMIELIEKRRDLALELARKSLQDQELDELTSTVAYHFLFKAELISGNYSRERIREFFMLTSRNEKNAEKFTELIMRERK